MVGNITSLSRLSILLCLLDLSQDINQHCKEIDSAAMPMFLRKLDIKSQVVLGKVRHLAGNLKHKANEVLTAALQHPELKCSYRRLCK